MSAGLLSASPRASTVRPPLCARSRASVIAVRSSSVTSEGCTPYVMVVNAVLRSRETDGFCWSNGLLTCTTPGSLPNVATDCATCPARA